MFLQRQIEDNIHACLPLVDLQRIVHEMIRVVTYYSLQTGMMRTYY